VHRPILPAAEILRRVVMGDSAKQKRSRRHHARIITLMKSANVNFQCGPGLIGAVGQTNRPLVMLSQRTLNTCSLLHRCYDINIMYRVSQK